MEKTAVQYARALASAYNITSLQLKKYMIDSKLFYKNRQYFFRMLQFK